MGRSLGHFKKDGQMSEDIKCPGCGLFKKYWVKTCLTCELIAAGDLGRFVETAYDGRGKPVTSKDIEDWMEMVRDKPRSMPFEVILTAEEYNILLGGNGVMSYIDAYGMIHANKYTQGENSQLFTVENLFLKGLISAPKGDIKLLSQNLKNCQHPSGLYPGLYSDYPDDHRRYQSHDNLTAVVAFGYRYEKQICKDVWEEIKRQTFRYDNLDAEFPVWNRLLHPRDIIFYGACAGNIICRLLLPVLGIICILSCLKKYKVRNGMKLIHTDGKLLTWVRCHAMQDSLIMQLTFVLCSWIIQQRKVFNYGWSGVFNIYFSHDHPNNILSKEL